jgi:excisionase family DNA binding protein
MIELQTFTNEQLLKASDVARILNISKALVYRLIQQGVIPSVRINHAVRVMPSDLNAYVKGCRKDFTGE